MSEPSRNLVTGKLMRALRLATLAATVALMFGFALPLLVANSGIYRSVTQQVLAFVLLTVVTVVAGVAALRDRPVGRVRWVLVAAVFAASALATTGIPAEHLMAEAEWSYGVVGWCLLLALVNHSAVAAAGCLGVFTVGSFAQLILTGQGHDVADLVVVTAIVLGCELPVVAIAMILRNLAATATTAIARQERARTDDAIAEQLHADHRLRYAELATTTVPLLTDLTTGTANLSDPTARAGYAVAAARLRRLFAEHDDVADPLLHELRACLDLAERNGISVYLGTCGEYPTPPLVARRALIEPALHAMATAESQARVTVLGSPTSVTVSVLTDVPSTETEPEPLAGSNVAVSVTRLVDGSKAWVEATWQATN
jgi:hypothetical protein